MIRWAVAAAALASLALQPIAAAQADAPLPDPLQTARAVDASLDAEVLTPEADVAPRCDDAVFLRRAWLDIVGDAPTPEHTIAFLLDRSPDKRARLVRDLLTDPQYGVNWARYWRDVIMYRRTEERALIAANALEADLSRRLNDNAPWDEIATDFITAAGDVRENGAAALLMAQEARAEEVTAEVARIFLGIQIQCAQCHDHKTDRWTRQQFHELAAFFPRIGLRPLQTPTRRSFQVVVSDRRTRVRPGANRALPTPEHLMADLENPDALGAAMQPKFFLTSAAVPFGTPDADRRGALAQWLTANEWFAQALVNRLWAELVGEGFYEPIDDLGPDHQATAPKTIQLLAAAFRDSGYDVKWLIETIAATQAYQREARPRRHAEGVPFAANVPQPLRADVLYNCLLSALDVVDPAEQGPRRLNGYGQRNGPREQFNVTFGYDPSDPREVVTGSIPQVLATMNSPQIAGALRAKKGVLRRLLAEIPDDRQLVAELYLRFVSRPPTEGELDEAVGYFHQVDNRPAAVEDLAWALVNSAEFRHRP